MTNEEIYEVERPRIHAIRRKYGFEDENSDDEGEDPALPLAARPLPRLPDWDDAEEVRDFMDAMDNEWELAAQGICYQIEFFY